MTNEHYDWAGETPSWKLRKYLNYAGKMRAKQRSKNPAPERDLLLHDQRKPPFPKERWSMPADRITLRQAGDRYAEKVIKPTRNEHNYKRQKSQLLLVIDHWGNSELIKDITAADLAAFRDHLLSQSLSPSTANSYVDFVQKVLTACVELWGVLDSAPRIKRLPLHRKKPRILTYEEEERLLKVCPLPLKRLVIFLLGTGLRKRDALNLTWDNIEFKKPDEQRGRVKVFASKTHWEYVVPLPSHVENMLQDMKRELPDSMPYVFTFIPTRDLRVAGTDVRHKRGVASHYKSDFNDFPIARAAAGLPDITIHTFRHTFASRLIEQDVPVADVARLLGHQGVSTVMRYAHARPEHYNPIMALLDRPAVPGVYAGEPQSRFEGML